MTSAVWYFIVDTLLKLSHPGTLAVSYPPVCTVINEYHVDFPWNSVPSRGFHGATLVAKYLAYDVLFIKYYIVVRLCTSRRGSRS